MVKFEFVVKGLKLSCEDTVKGRKIDLELDELSINGSLDEVKEIVESLGKAMKNDTEGTKESGIVTKADFHESAWFIYSDLGKSFVFNGDTYKFIKFDNGMNVLQINGTNTGMCIKNNYGKKKFIKFHACEMANDWGSYDALKD